MVHSGEVTMARDENHGGPVVAGAHAGRDVRYHDTHPSDLHLGLYRQTRCPGLVITVAADGRHWGDRAKAGQDLRRPHITRMDDVVHALEKLDHPRIEVAVGVGEDANCECAGRSRRIGFAVGHVGKVSPA